MGSDWDITKDKERRSSKTFLKPWGTKIELVIDYLSEPQIINKLVIQYKQHGSVIIRV